MFSVRDPIPLDLRSHVVYKFSFAGCNACYTSRHLSMCVRGYLSRGRNSHIYQHLQQSQACWGLANKNCFSIVDCAPNKLQLMLEEAMHIKSENPTLNKQLKHADLTLLFWHYFYIVLVYFILLLLLFEFFQNNLQVF